MEVAFFALLVLFLAGSWFAPAPWARLSLGLLTALLAVLCVLWIVGDVSIALPGGR